MRMVLPGKARMSDRRIVALGLTGLMTVACLIQGLWLTALLGVSTFAIGVPWRGLSGRGEPDLRSKGMTFGAIILGIIFGATYVVSYSQSPEGKAAIERTRKENEAEAARRAVEKRKEEFAETERQRLEEQAKAAEKQKEELADAEYKRKGFQCLSDWDGAHRGLKEAVKEHLRNPSSFEHVETVITPVDDQGQHRVIMTYHAENGFGGVNVEQAIGIIDHEGCRLINLTLPR